MHYILTALKSEAKPIIDYYDLVFDNSHPIPIYKNDIYTLLITGVGKVNVYNALTTYYKNKDMRKSQFINIGIAGGHKNDCDLGQLFLINKVFDDFSKIPINLQYENYFGLLKNKVNTVSKPITNGEFKRKGLVDMEAYKICEVIKKVDDIDNLFILKIVSDFMDLNDGLLSSKQVYNLIEQNLVVIDSFLNAIRKLQHYK
jgi:hypothetical protein